MECNITVGQGAAFGDPYFVGYEMRLSINGKYIGSYIGDIDRELIRRAYWEGFEAAKERGK